MHPAPEPTTTRPALPRPAATPVVVVGAGPVGQSAALLLARWQVPVILLDARPQRDPVGSKALCHARDILDVWESVGAGATLAADGVTWDTARTYYRDAEISRWTFTDTGRSPFPPFVNVGQQRVEEVLDARLAAEPLVDVRWGHEVIGIDQDDDGATMTVRVGPGATEDRVGPRGIDDRVGDTTVLRAPYVVCCAGSAGGRLRRALGVDFEGVSFDDLFLICDVRADLPGWERERRFWFDPPWNPGRQVLVHACPDSTYRIDWQVSADYDLAADEQAGGLDRRIRQVIGDRPYELRWRSVYRFHSRRVPRMRVGRVLLAGDCAHLMSPFGARGLNSGVLDADNLAWKLAFVVHGWAGEGLLDSYDAERMAAAAENLEVTGATMRFLVPSDDVRRAARERVLEDAARDPDRVGDIDSGRFAEPFWYHDLPLTTPDPSRPPTGRPAKGTAPPPGPGVLLPDLPVRCAGLPGVTRLRELARLGVLLLTAPGVDVSAVDQAVRPLLRGAPGLVVAACDLVVPPASAATTRAEGAEGAEEAQGAAAAADPAGRTDVPTVLGMRAGEVWVVRPDAYVAAAVSPGPALDSAVRRA
ncbi:MAG: FAD-dependent monooxygenase, partial [Dermatophilaceae bacterium]